MTERKENRDEANADIAAMEAQMDHTRREISGDLRTLGEKLSPGHLKQEAKEVMQEAKNVAVETLHEAKDVATSTFREVKDSALDTVHTKVDDLRHSVRQAERETVGFLRENAVPLGLMGIGAAWFMSKRRQRRAEEYWRYEYGGRWMPADERAGSEPGVSLGERAAAGTRQLKEQVAERARSVAEGAEQKFDTVKERVRDVAGRELGQMRQAAEQTEHKVSEAAGRAREIAGRELREARDYSRRVTDENPLAVGLAAIAAGIGVGLLLPPTRPERELLGGKRDELLGEAKQALSEFKHTAKETARDVRGTLTGSPTRH